MTRPKTIEKVIGIESITGFVVKKPPNDPMVFGLMAFLDRGLKLPTIIVTTHPGIPDCYLGLLGQYWWEALYLHGAVQLNCIVNEYKSPLEMLRAAWCLNNGGPPLDYKNHQKNLEAMLASEAYELGMEGCQQSYNSRKASPAWKEAALGAVYAVAQARELFSADDIWPILAELPLLDENTPHPSALGRTMLEAHRRGWIEKSGDYVRSLRPSTHTRPLLVWHSLISRREV